MRHDRIMMPSAARPTTSSGWREFLRVMMLRAARTTAIALFGLTIVVKRATRPYAVASQDDDV